MSDLTVNIKVATRGDITIISLYENILASEVNEYFISKVKEALDAECKKMIIDMTNVLFINSLVLGTLSLAHRELLQNGGRLIVSNIGNTKKIFDIAHSSDVLTIVDTLEDAIQKLSN
ncbi:MAG: STAS domain-containing protein [Candidatus Kapabacteria bacterium]|nr:STAS domain-containing protein [Candidatus Kapabacteria bacterium]